MSKHKRWLTVAVFAVAMAWVEAALVSTALSRVRRLQVGGCDC
jgi:hypothetical protein